MEEKNNLEQQSLFDFDCKCPVCGKNCDSYQQLITHINRSRKEHMALKEVLAIDKIKALNNYTEFTQTFDSVKDKYEEKINEYKKNNKIKSEEEKSLNKEAHNLVSGFFQYTKSKSTNWARDLNMIKSHLKADKNSNEIKIVLRYLIKRGDKDLRYFNSVVNEALTVEQCKKEFKISGTDANLVYEFYKKTNQKLTDRLMYQGIKKITELKNEDYTKEEILIGINYMVSINERCFNFLPNKIEEALSKNTSIDDMAKQYDSYEELITDILNGKIYYGTIILEENILKKSVVLNLKSDLINGLVDLKRLSTSYKKIGVLLAKEILNNNLYNKKFTKQQWIDIINL